MATTSELTEVVKNSLEKRGVLNQVKARIRAEVYSAIERPTEGRPVMSNENILINELIREYLLFNKYQYTTSVLTAESGMAKEPLDREFLRMELNVVEDAPSRSIPLLYSIVSHYTQKGPAASSPHHRSRTAFKEHSTNEESMEGSGPDEAVVIKGLPR